MTVYPFELDNDSTILRIDDNLSELGVDVINQIRDAIFAIESELGISPSGSMSSVTDRLDVSLNANGTIKSSALTSIGLVSLPIDNAQVGAAAGILESKLTLDYNTSDLNALIQSNIGTINSITSFVTVTNSDLLAHIAGTDLADASTSRHVGTHIDLNAVPFDSRDPFFIWDGLKDRTGTLRSATTVGEALLEINDDYNQHQLNETGDAHLASGISVDTSDFFVIPKSSDTVQAALQSIDDANTVIIQTHQQNLHSNGLPRESRSNLIGNVDGYSSQIVPSTPCTALLINAPSTTPVDNNTTGDDIVSFSPINSGYEFDEKFARVSVGDTIRVNYGNGIEGVFIIESKRHIPGSEWIIRINGINLANADGYSAFASIDKGRFETNNWGTLAVAAVNNDINPAIMGSVIVGNPQGAQVLGFNFDQTCFDSTHYNLHLVLYPFGNPSLGSVDLPAIDVTGNQGITPGKYTLDSIVHTTNNVFRSAGYNYRFIAFQRYGEFGIMLADTANGASFSIANGIVSDGVLIPGGYSNNVIDDAGSGKDALGFGFNKAALASPKWFPSWSSAIEAQSLPTRIFYPLANKQYVSNGISRDTFADTYMAPNGYWDGYISNRVPVGITTVETTYQIFGNLSSAGLKSGKTIVVQPAIEKSNPLFSNVDYGRFIIKEVNFSDCACENDAGDYTSITVINSLHATGFAVGNSAIPELPVKVYFSEDSVSFNQSNVADAINASDYIRYHEIYITEFGNTFSHERARMPEQFETTELLSTASFKIKEVSPKLKGYLGSGTNNKYVRFYVLSTDSVTGEYDGYIGKRVEGSPGVTEFGRIIKARKNVPIRFYDASDVDYIEFEYSETNQSPGASVISTQVPRYVDVQIFDTMATNQEVFRLAGVNIVENVVYVTSDLRELGNVSEIDFTDSAINFIEASVRYLHSNGVINGLNYTGNNSGVLSFNGGLALINGHVTAINAQKISVPEIVKLPGPVQTLDWVICADKFGSLTMLPLSEEKIQFFGRKLSQSANYYIPSVSFSELIDDRKDLVILAITNVTIASITVNSVQDSRRFVTNQDLNTWTFSADNKHKTTFRNAESLLNWVNRYGLNEVRLVPSDISQKIDLRELTSDLIIKGDKNKDVLVTSDIGIHANSFLKINNIKFVYNSTFSNFSIANDLSHVSDGLGCVYFDGSLGDINNVGVENCDFSRTENSQRCPFILVKAVDDGYVSDLIFKHNKFTSGNADNLNSSIAFYADCTTIPAYIVNSVIDHNDINGKNSLLFTNKIPDASFVARGVEVTWNSLPEGCIGNYFIGTSSELTHENGLLIDNNKFALITRLSRTGKYVSMSSPTDKGVGILNITNNNAQIISATATTSNVNYRSSLNINNNTLIKKYDISYFSDWSFTTDRAITGSVATSGGSLSHKVSVTKNSIFGIDDLKYEDGIFINGGHACENIIHAFSDVGVLVGTSNSEDTIISKNKIFRDGNVIEAYIRSSATKINAYDNILDSSTNDGVDEETIEYVDGSYIERNINHIKTTLLSFSNAMVQMNTSGTTYAIEYDDSGFSAMLSYIRTEQDGYISRVQYLNGTSLSVHGNFYLNKFLPPDVKIVGASCNFSCANLNWASGNVSLQLRDSSTTTGSSGGTLLDSSDTTLDVTTTITDTLSFVLNPYVKIDGLNLKVLHSTMNPDSNGIITSKNLLVKYTW